MENLLYTLWLHLIPGIGPYLVRQLLKHFDSYEQIYTSSIPQLTQVPHIGEALAKRIYTHKNLEAPKHILDYCLEHHIQLTSYQDPTYPLHLALYPKAPTLLYVKGNLLPLNTPRTIAIVGARRCSPYGKEATLTLATRMAKEDNPIISGMAKGIDSYAHIAAIQANGYTAAVVGTGLDHCYPSEHLSLMNKIAETGAVISQFPPFSASHKQNFIRRNELIAMLSNQIFIMQASKTSGSLYTAECGFALHKEVFALPGSIYDPLHEGSNLLIAKGAKIYLPSLPTYPCTTSNTSQNLSNSSQKICKLLASAPLSIDSLQAKLHLSLNLLEELLLELELQNIIYQAGGLIHLNRCL